MLPVLGKPLIVRTMERLRRAGIQNYSLILGENEGGVAAYLNSQWLPNVSVEFLVQSGYNGLFQVLQELVKRHQQPFVLIAYNALTHSRFVERLIEKYQDKAPEGIVICGASTTLSNSVPSGFVLVEGQRVKAVEREKSDAQSLLLMNLAVCGSEFIEYLISLPPNLRKSALELFTDYLHQGGQVTIAETAWVLPVETDHDLLAANKLLLNDGQDAHILSEIPRTVQVIPPVRIDPQVSISPGAKIGPHVYLESGCSVGANVVLSSAVVLQNAIVPAGSVLHDVVVDSRIKIQV